MKCSRCSYFNLPGTVQCGRCARELNAPNAPVAAEDFLPPRAASRTMRQKVESGLSPVTRQRMRQIEQRSVTSAHRAADSARDTARYVSEETLRESRPWLGVVLSLLPGLGHLLTGHRAAAFTFAISFVMALLAWALTFRFLNSDFFGVVALAIQWMALFDATRYALDRDQRVPLRTLRLARIAILSVALQSTLLAGGFLFLTSRNNLLYIADPQQYWAGRVYFLDPHPVFAWNDVLLWRALRQGETIARDERVVANGATLVVGHVIALGGDHVRADGVNVWVNNARVARERFPNTWRPPANYTFRVPQGHFWLAHITSDQVYTNLEEFELPTWSIVSRPRLEGIITGRLNPPARRSLFSPP